jgi:hypothetical protein
MPPKRDADAARKNPPPPKKQRPKFQKTSPLFEKILQNKPFENVIRNAQHNFWEDSETGIVFDPVTKVAVGVHVNLGNIRSLSPAELEIARERGWKTVAVENLKQHEEVDTNNGRLGNILQQF